MSSSATRSPAASPAGRTRPSRRSPWRVLLGLLLLLIVVPLALMITLSYGEVSGEEFSPDSLDRRTFTYYELPIVRIQVSAVYRTATTNNLERALAARYFVTAADPRWDLVRIRSRTIGAQRGDAALLCNYLDIAAEGGTLVWQTWTEKRPELAKELWPVVIELARRKQYILIPELMRLASSRGDASSDPAKDAAQLKQEIAAFVADRCLKLGLDQQSLGKHHEAIEWFTSGLQCAPGQMESLRARAESYDAIGEGEKAAADRQSAPATPEKPEP